MKLVLELGSGKKPYKPKKGEKVIHLDTVKLPDVEVIHDLNSFPYPFKDNSFDKIIATHVLEHLADLPRVMEELWRILKPGGILKITVPHFSSHNAFCDPTHRRYFTFETFDYWDSSTQLGKDFGFYISHKARFKILYKEVRIRIYPFSISFKFRNSKALKFYELYLSRIFPASEIYFELKAQKSLN